MQQITLDTAQLSRKEGSKVEAGGGKVIWTCYIQAFELLDAIVF